MSADATSGYAYAEAFEQLLPQLPEAQRAARREQLQSFLQQGFPTRKLEDWHYTDLAALAARRYVNAAAGSVALDRWFLPRSDRLVYVDGRLDAAQSTADELSAPVAPVEESDTDGVRALNAAFALPGLDLKLGSNARIARVLHVLIATTPGSDAGMSHQRHRIDLGAMAEATVVVEFVGCGAGDRLATHSFDVRLGAGARLRLVRVQDEAAGSTLLTRFDLRLDRDANVDAVCVDRGGGLARHDFNVDLAAAGAEVRLDGLFVPVAGAHIDNHTRILHSAPHCRSSECFKGIVAEGTRAVFNGKIVVRPGAQKTDSQQRVASLLLSRRAEIDAKPELEIYADDVKCAHGATTGQLDETALAYLRSRGIDLATARALLLKAFATEILARVEPASLAARLHALLQLPADEPMESLA
jgi:Fe-S cluster assembly protein SufD